MTKTYAENPSLCFQCARCSAGCPMAPDMDILPHQIIHLLALGREMETLGQKTLWLCAGCSTCAVRCPNDIDIMAVMDRLRQRSIELNIPCPLPDIHIFHQTFLSEIAKRGKISEIQLMARFNLRIRKLFQNIDLLPAMLIRRRLKLAPVFKPMGFKRFMRKRYDENQQDET